MSTSHYTESILEIEAAYTDDELIPARCPTAAELQMGLAPVTVELEALTANTKYLGLDGGITAQRFLELSTQYNTGPPIVPTLGLKTEELHLSPSTLSDLLGQHLPPADSVYLFPPSQIPQDIDSIVAGLVDHLDHGKSQYDGISSSIMYDCPPEFDLATPQMSPESSPDIFSQAPKQTLSVMPCGGSLPLECSTLTQWSEVHLLTGVRVYFIWPRTINNMALMEIYLDSEGDVPRMELQQSLEGGVTFVQHPGQLVTLPPFCPTLVFATQTSAAVVFGFRDVKSLPLRLRHIGLLGKQVKELNRHDAQRADRILEYQLLQFYKDMGELLLGTAAQSTPPTQLDTLLAFSAQWSEARLAFRTAIKQHTTEAFRNISWRTCRSCGVMQ